MDCGEFCLADCQLDVAKLYFAIQTMVYQINAFVGLYEWYRSEQKPKVQRSSH